MSLTRWATRGSCDESNAVAERKPTTSVSFATGSSDSPHPGHGSFAHSVPAAETRILQDTHLK
jgi:hypothetical protein